MVNGDKMAKKKKITASSNFQSNPFHSVRGFCVSAPPQVPAKVESVPPREALHGAVNDDEEVDFARSMAAIGVTVLEQESPVLAVAEPVAAAAGETTATVELSDEALFAASLGCMDRVFVDAFPEEEAPAALPRRMKQLRQGKIRPEDQLDLHGCNRDEARLKVRTFLQSRHGRGMKTVLIVTGRGNRSVDGASVLRDEIERYLTIQAGAWVAEWGRAPRQYGGDGALVVFLRG